MPDYKTLRGTSTFTYEEKRSRFIATAAFADTARAKKCIFVSSGAKMCFLRRGVSKGGVQEHGAATSDEPLL